MVEFLKRNAWNFAADYLFVIAEGRIRIILDKYRPLEVFRTNLSGTFGGWQLKLELSKFIISVNKSKGAIAQQLGTLTDLIYVLSPNTKRMRTIGRMHSIDPSLLYSVIHFHELIRLAFSIWFFLGAEPESNLTYCNLQNN